MRKLLEEAAKVLTDARFNAMQGPLSEGQKAMIDGWAELRSRISASLSEPEPDAMELVRKIREELNQMFYLLDEKQAVALIADFGKRVPRAMLEEIFDNGYQAGDEFGAYDDIDPARKDFDTIAEKFGYRAE